MLKRAVLEKKVKEQIKQCANETRSLHIPITKTDRHAPLVLSFAQQRLWFIGQFDSAASRAYHIPVALRLTGKLEHQALISALDNLVARQESLRTHFTLVDDQPCQKIAPADTGFSMSYLDLRSLNEDERSARVDELAESEARTPFDLTQGPLIRGQLLHLDNEEHVLLLTQHHIISDGWSSGILIRELAAFYQAALTGRDADLPPLPIQYADYAAWQRTALHCDELTVQRDFWYNQLNGAPSLLELPTDRPRPAVQSYRGSKIPVHLDEELLTALKTFAQNQGATLFMAILTAWTVVLSRLSGQNDIVIGLPIANRTRTELDNLIGFFVNTLALRIESGQCHTIAELLAHVRKQTLAAYAHQDLPFEQVVEVLQPERSLSHSPIFQVMLALDNTPAQELKLPGLELSIIEQPQYSAQCDLTLSFTETAGNSGLTGTLIYATDLFDRETVVRIAGYFQNVITAMIADVTQTISSLPMLSAMEQQQLLVDFNATQADFPQNALIHELFEQQVAQTPEAIAVVCEGQTLSYEQINRQANQLAHYLIGLGIQPDDRVAICVERSPALIVCLLGILKAGGAYVPLDPNYPAERLTYMLKDAAPVILLTQVAQRDKLPDIVPVRVIDAQDTSLETRSSETLSLVTQPSHNPDAQALGLTSRHLAYVIYTSGSTGQPKGVMIEHRNVNRLAINGGYADIGPNDCVAHCSNIAFDASTWEIWSALLNGGRLHVIPQAVLLNPERFRDELISGEVTAMLLTVGLFNAYLEILSPLFRQLRYLLVGGEALNPKKIQQVQLTESRPVHLINAYGPTETTTIATTYAITSTTNVAYTIPIGRPIANTQIYILDSSGQPTPLGVVGEIYIGGAGVARGYLNRPELTRERFLPDWFSAEADARMYKTGDLGRWLPDGNIEYLGRNDFQVKLRGFRIELDEIESRLNQYPGINESIVIAREDIPGDKRLVAYVQTQPDIELIPTKLRQYLTQHLADYMLPSAFVILDTFPLTPNGKLDRNALPAPDLSAVITRDYAEPVGDVETTLSEIWQNLLGLERVGRHDHFFELGGHSLIAVSLIEQLCNRGYSLEVRSVFATPLLADMAQAIQTGMDAPMVLVPPNRIPDDCTAITPEMLPLVTLSQTEIDTVTATVTGGIANVQDIYPLSPLQEGILFHHQLQENSDAYLLNTLLAFDTQARLEAFLAALQQVTDRHDILRTAFCWQGLSQPVQVVWRKTSLPVTPFIPASTENISEQLQAHIAIRLDITQAPLFAASTVYDPDNHEWLLGLSFHHLVSDHITLELLMGEIQQLLQGEIESLPVPLPYRNFIAQMLNIPPSVHEGYFRERLAEIDEPTAPFGLLNVQGDGTDMMEARLCLDITLAQTLRVLARQLGISPSVLFHVAWAQVLAHTSGRDDVVFGTVLSGRLQGTTGADQVMGMFINTLPVRISLNNHTVLEVVRATAKDLADLLEHEQFPLALAQRFSSVTPPQPLFSALFNYRHSPSNSTDKPGWKGVRSLPSEEWSNYPLDLSVDDFGDGFALVAQAVNSVDPNRVVNYMYTALCGLTDALQNNPRQPVLALSILPVAERQQLLEVFNATQTDFLPSEALIHTLFEQRTQQAPDAIAIISEHGSLSYDELNRRANQLANALITAGIQPDDRVALCVERSPDMIIGILGILKAGAAYVPLDPNHPDKRRTYILSDSTPKLLLTQQHLQSQALNNDIPVWFLDEADYLERIVQYSVANPEPEQLGLQSHHLAYVIYTSGSTGLPKGVMVEHRNVVNFTHAQCQITALTAADRVLQFATIAFDASVAEIFPTLATGATLILRPPHLQIPDAAFGHFLQEQAISVVDIPTAFWHQWGQEIKAGRSGFSSTLRSITVGGEKTNLHSLTDWQSLPETQHCRWTDTYGPTEATVIVTSLSLNGGALHDADETLSIGRPIANCRIYLLDKKQQPVPLGVTGEIYIGGASVARGYLNHSDLTAERFVADPFSSQPDARMYKTGDLGRWLPDGNIEYLGRNDFQVKIRGFRIEPGEIEAQLADCQGVREAVVIAHKADNGEQRLVAYLVSQPDVTLEAAELREQLRSCLADYMLPNAFVMLDAFPLTPNGKLDRNALPAPDLSAVITRDYAAPTGDVEIALAQIWQDLLGLERVGRHDHFFELGGHSLITVSLIEQLRRRGYSLAVRSVFTTPILAEMAQAITRQETPDDGVPPNRIPDGCTHVTPDMLPLVTLSQTAIDTIAATVTGGHANVQDIYPLAPLQAGILFHHQLQETGDAYLLNSLLAFDTRARREAFLDALQQIIDRHDTLRTAFCWQGLSQPVQVVWRQAKLPVTPFVPTSADNIPAQLQAHIVTRLDISQAPLFTANTTYDPASDEWLLILNFHHLVSDHMTLELILDEIQQLLQGQADTLSPPLPYRNFIAQTLRVPASVHEAYFREQLADIDAPTAPFGLLNVQEDGTDIAGAHLPLDSTLANTLREQARCLGISPSVLFHVACAQVLAHTSDRDDVVFGTVLLGRLQGTTGADQAMGMFINTLPIRISLGHLSVRETVENTARNLATLLAHEQAPLALAQRCSSVIPPLPLFSVLFNYRHNSSSSATHPRLEGMRLLDAKEQTNYPLALSVDDFGDSFILGVQSVTGIDPDRMVHYLYTALQNLTEALHKEPLQPILDLPILPVSERQQILVDFNATQADFPQHALIHELVEQQVVLTPEALAVVGEAHTLSYAALNRQANQLAHYLIELGVKPDDRVAICTERSPAMIVGLLAILKAGGAYVPLDPAYPAERLAYMLEDAAPVVLLTQTTLRDSVGEFALPIVRLDDLPSPLLAKQPDTNPVATMQGLTSRHLAYVIYTSGSTGQPKGVAVTHRNTVNFL
ncbi:amino acid adenylation domain-containing protein, partial [Xenorhabdus sp. PB30.3]|nr:amino acid adenylation domain-containing protein [Xenorhabdus sp. PB30.3]